MKRGYIIVLVIVLAVLALFIWVKNSYNGLVKADEQVKAAWSQVENVYQRRADLIPNLVNTVKGYTTHESETLEAVTAARAKATQMTVDATSLDAESMQRFQEAQGELSQALGRLLSITENYPDLKASQQFIELQAQLEGTENRISTERTRYSDMVAKYNAMLRKFPGIITAKIFGFEAKPQFTAEEGSEKAPEVKF